MGRSDARLLARIAVLETMAQGQSPADCRFEQLQAEWDQLEERIRELEDALASERQRAVHAEVRFLKDAQRARSAYAEQALAIEAEIPSAAFPRGFFVYILRDAAGEPLYVGQSRNLLGRLGQHACDPEKASVASYSVLRCESQQHMDATEQALIGELRPSLNITYNRWTETASV